MRVGQFDLGPPELGVADYSIEITALAKVWILGQASTAMISQVGQSQQHVLSLLR